MTETIEQRLDRLEKLVAEIALAAFYQPPISYEASQNENRKLALWCDAEALLAKHDQ